MNAPALADKVAIVTGAGNGIGRAISITFAAAGAVVACVDVEGNAAEATARTIAETGARSRAVRCDVSVEADARAALEAVQSAFGAIHVLVNAAATDDPNGTILDLIPAQWD
ncbi:MAG: SDR family NAD(P)-dependent oxidoreductase, partial [Pseudomonadota bacterium]|nr:SDR family NAD(P)-dependent oxidoreductase [Pseudomonadota bacterium]